ncbi:MAG: MgtC/SapB family protein [Candidatus Azobacteroides sp.]|nr:MgtC/SapB family protein [Candidatus Azobacteroides sp.]
MKDWLVEIIKSEEITLSTTIFRMLLSFFLGCLVGFERQLRNHAAGVRTFALICLASTLIMIVSIYVSNSYSLTSDPARIAAQVVTGVGFLGAGVIFQNKGGVIRGLTTAAGIFMMAGIGLTIGVGLYTLALISSFMLLFILSSLERIESKMQLDTSRKKLLIQFNHIDMELTSIEKILKENNIFIFSTSISENFETNTGTATFMIAVPSRVSLTALFNKLRQTTGAFFISLESI